MRMNSAISAAAFCAGGWASQITANNRVLNKPMSLSLGGVRVLRRAPSILDFAQIPPAERRSANFRMPGGPLAIDDKLARAASSLFSVTRSAVRVELSERFVHPAVCAAFHYAASVGTE
jgi:hypothetical protein